ncbi:MAG: hypothetical protein ACRELF_04280 [Gemmataceae bacterium]
MRTWTRLIPAVLLLLPFTGASLRADAETNAKKIEQLQKDVEKIRKDLESLRNDVKNSSARGAKIAEDLQEITKLLRDMASKQETLTRQAGYGPGSVSPGGAPPATGTIKVQNNYTAPATVYINDRSFRVEPGRIGTIGEVPTGLFQYSVDVEGYGAIRPPQTATLRPGGYRINIFPKMPY